MKNVILTEGNKERLKILSFLFRVYGYPIQAFQDLGLALEHYQGLCLDDQRSTMLVVVDYHHLGPQREQRFEKLAMLAHFEPLLVLLAAHRWTNPERIALAEQVPNSGAFLMCHSHQIIDFVDRYHAETQGLQPSRSACS